MSLLLHAASVPVFQQQAFLLGYGPPQFLFHVTTAYDLLRHNGVAIGNTNCMGAY